MDQDNAIIFAEGEPGSAADQWIARLGSIIADILHEVGVPYCKGGVMASNPAGVGRAQPGMHASPTGLRAPIRPTSCQSISSSILSACMATPRLQMSFGVLLSTRAGQCRLCGTAGGSGRRG